MVQYSLRPCRRWCRAVLWWAMLCLLTLEAIPCSRCASGREAMQIDKLNSTFWTRVGMGMRLACISMASVSDVLIALVMVMAAECWICVNLLTMPCEPRVSDCDPALKMGLSQMLAMYSIFGTAIEQ